MSFSVTTVVYDEMMAYPVNIEEAGHTYHVWFKCVNDRFALVKKHDIHTFFAFMQHYKAKHRISLFAYSILSNHVHLLIKNPADDHLAIKHFLRDVKREYAKYFNVRYGEAGSLFKRGYRKKTILNKEQFFNNLVYILNNPVQAGLCDQAEDFNYSPVHLLLTKKEFNTTKFILPEDLALLYKKAKKQHYGEGLSESQQAKRGLEITLDKQRHRRELSRGKKNYKRRGKFRVWFESRAKKEVTSGPFPPPQLNDSLPNFLDIDPKFLKSSCHLRAKTQHPSFVLNDKTSVFFESKSKAACFVFQRMNAHSLPDSSLSPRSISKTPDGTWQVATLRGRPPNQKLA